MFSFQLFFFKFPQEVDNCDDNELSLSTRNLLLFSANESDVKFVFTKGSNLEIFIYAHKRILSIGSCVFDQMFNGLMALCSNDSDSMVYISDIPIECFKNLLTFIYIGAVELKLENVMEVIYAAHKYEVCKLESLCCDFLYKNMDISNVLQIYEATLIFNNNITKQCLQWIDDLFDDLTKWQCFVNLKKATLMELLQRDTLNVGELSLFKAVYKWAENQCCDASIEPNDVNLRKAADNFKDIRFPTMKFSEFAECNRFGLNILTPEEKIDIWDAISEVKDSVLFNSKKRIQSAMSYKAFSFSYYPAPYNATTNYFFEFSVSRIVYLTAISVIRNCIVTIYEKEPGEIDFIKGMTFVVYANETKELSYSFVPNVEYALTTVDYSFKCVKNLKNFESYSEQQQYYNRISSLGSWNFSEHDPFFFETPQFSLVRIITYKTSKQI